FLECTNDVDPVCHKERIPQQTAQHPDGAEYRVFVAVADADDDHLTRVLPQRGERGVTATAGGTASRVVDLQSAGVLSLKDPCNWGGGRGRGGLMVWSDLQRSEAGELFCAVRHRSRGVLQGISRHADA